MQESSQPQPYCNLWCQTWQLVSVSTLLVVGSLRLDEQCNMLAIVVATVVTTVVESEG